MSVERVDVRRQAEGQLGNRGLYERQPSDKQVQKGIGLAILDLADAVREVASAIRDRPASPRYGHRRR